MHGRRILIRTGRLSYARQIRSQVSLRHLVITSNYKMALFADGADEGLAPQQMEAAVRSDAQPKVAPAW